MKKLTILTCAVALLGFSVGGYALSFGHGGKGGDLNKDGEFTRAEAQQLAEKHFDRLDKDDDGKVDLTELSGKDEQKKTKYNLMLRQVDGNDDDVITSPEFIAYSVKKFDDMDSDNNGVLTDEERVAGRQAFHEEIMKLHFEDADTNGDGALSWEEFVNMRDTFSHYPRGGRNHKWRKNK